MSVNSGFTTDTLTVAGLKYPTTTPAQYNIIEVVDSKTAEYTDTPTLAGMSVGGVNYPTTTGLEGQVPVLGAGGTTLDWGERTVLPDVLTITSSSTLTATDMGKCYVIAPPSGTEIVVTLPVHTTLPAGMTTTTFSRSMASNTDTAVSILLQSVDTFNDQQNVNTLSITKSNKTLTVLGSSTTGYTKLQAVEITATGSQTVSSVPATSYTNLSLVWTSPEASFFTDNGDGTVTANIEGLYTVSYHVFLESTGGLTYECKGRVTVNGTAVPLSDSVFVNFSNEDAILSEYVTNVNVAVGDVLATQVLVDANFIGTVVGATTDIFSYV